MSQHDDLACENELRDALGRDPEGVLDVTVSMSPPLVRGPYTTDPFTCPHGVAYWIEPTGEQIARWASEGIR